MEWRVLVFTVSVLGCLLSVPPICSSTITIGAEPPVAIHGFHVIITCTVTHAQDTLPAPITLTSPHRGLCVTMNTDGTCSRAKTTCGEGIPGITFTCRDIKGSAVVTMVNTIIDDHDHGTYICSHDNEDDTTTVSNIGINETTFYSSRPSDNQVNIFCSFRRDGDGTVPALMISPPWREGDPTDDTYKCLSFAGDDNCQLHDQCNDTRYSVLPGDINHGCHYRTGITVLNPLAVLILNIQNPGENDYGDWRCYVNDNLEQETQLDPLAPGDVEFTADITGIVPMDTITMSCVYSHTAMATDYELTIIHPSDGSVCMRMQAGADCELFNNCTAANLTLGVCEGQPLQQVMELQIFNPTEEDTGPWICAYNNPNNIKDVTTLHTLVPPIAVAITEVVSATIGSEVVMECDVQELFTKRELTFNWTREGDTTWLEINEGTLGMTVDTFLYREYKCAPTNLAGVGEPDMVRLYGTITAEGDRPDPEIHVLNTDPGLLVSCTYEAWPAPNISVTGAEFPLMVTGIREAEMPDGRIESNINITWDQTSDLEQRKQTSPLPIRCVGQDHDGQIEDDIFTMKVEYKPVLQSLEINPPSVYVGDDVNLTCVVYDVGNPAADTFTWLLDGAIITETPDPQFIFTVSSINENGTYTCKAANHPLATPGEPLRSNNVSSTLTVEVPIHDGTSAAVIAGSVLGGLLLLALIVVLVMCIMRRETNSDGWKVEQYHDTLDQDLEQHSQNGDAAQLGTHDAYGAATIDETIANYSKPGVSKIRTDQEAMNNSAAVGNQSTTSADDDDATSESSQGDSTRQDDDEVGTFQDPSGLYAKVDKSKKKQQRSEEQDEEDMSSSDDFSDNSDEEEVGDLKAAHIIYASVDKTKKSPTAMKKDEDKLTKLQADTETYDGAITTTGNLSGDSTRDEERKANKHDTKAPPVIHDTVAKTWKSQAPMKKDEDRWKKLQAGAKKCEGQVTTEEDWFGDSASDEDHRANKNNVKAPIVVHDNVDQGKKSQTAMKKDKVKQKNDQGKTKEFEGNIRSTEGLSCDPSSDNDHRANRNNVKAPIVVHDNVDKGKKSQTAMKKDEAKQKNGQGDTKEFEGNIRSSEDVSCYPSSDDDHRASKNDIKAPPVIHATKSENAKKKKVPTATLR